MIVYNLFPLLAGPSNGWEPHLDRAADMGFDWVYLNPIQQSGRSGSLYAIADYFRIDARFVDAASPASPEQQLREAIRYAESRGMRVMIDLVINHCAADSALVREHPGWFVRRDGGGVAHPSCVEDGRKVVWRDLAQLDYRHGKDPEGLFHYFLEVAEYLIDLGVSGFRCDAAYQIPRHHWERFIAAVKARHPQVVFVAETLGCTPSQTRKTAATGFDYVFNSVKWWDFGSPWLMEQYDLVRETAPSIGFPESHDTPRLFEESHGNVAVMKQRYLFSALFSAGVLMPIGFELGFRKRLHVVKTRPEDWEESGADLREFVHAVNDIKRRWGSFHRDCAAKVLEYENPAVLVLWKACPDLAEEALLVLNKDPHHHQHFYAGSLNDFVQSGQPPIDVSPEYRLEYLPAPFVYDLRPGQGFAFVVPGEA
jgi:starch synthase (maltosyl-transferring)